MEKQTNSFFIHTLQKAHDRKNGYGTPWPYNVGYYDGQKITWDCIGLIKSICWTHGKIVDNYDIGTCAAYDPTQGLDDLTEKGILDACSDVSSNFKNIEAGEYLYFEDGGHAGVYVGNGHVIECTLGWGLNGVIESDIDNAGRSFYKGVQRGRWIKHGKLPFVDYKQIIKVGDIVTINPGACIYGSNIKFAPFIYGIPHTVIQLDGMRAVVSNDTYGVEAVNVDDLTLYEAPKEESKDNIIEAIIALLDKAKELLKGLLSNGKKEERA